MREALARSDLDFTVSEPTGRRRGAPDITRLPSLLRGACIATAAAVCVAILANALLLQDRKHPAPLLRAPDSAPAAELAPLPAPRPAASSVAPAPAASTNPRGNLRDPIADELSRTAAGPDRKPARAAPAPGKPADAHGDAIASLIGAAPSEPSAAVAAAQKALVRLGYVLRADGVIGATTHQAIERYERDNKLPVRGELTPKIARELAAKSGVGTH